MEHISYIYARAAPTTVIVPALLLSIFKILLIALFAPIQAHSRHVIFILSFQMPTDVADVLLKTDRSNLPIYNAVVRPMYLIY